MSRIIFMGRTGCGKTTLCQKLNQLELKYKKTQAVEVYDNAIDTPGEYLENRHFYSALIQTSVDAQLIAILADPTVDANYIPPAFTGTFAKEVIGIVTKINVVDDAKKIDRVKQELRAAGIQTIFLVDTVDGTGIETLFEYIHSKIDSR